MKTRKLETKNRRTIAEMFPNLKTTKLLSIAADAKTVKGQKKGYLTGILYLAPSTQAGLGDLCPKASDGCREACLFRSGRAETFSSINQARIRKTREFMNHRQEFMRALVKDIGRLKRKAKREGLTPVVRLNGTSDISWERIKIEIDGERKTLSELFPEIQFYGYTKNYLRFTKPLPENWHLTFSRSEENEEKAIEVLRKGYNVAVVFDGLPKTWKGAKVINGDETDLRFLDEAGVVVGLKAKGSFGKSDDSGFVVKVAK